MKRFRLTDEALGDLQDIWEYISKDSPDAADRVLDEFHEAFGRLALMPGMGHRREDLTKQDVLFWPVRSYLVIYKTALDPVSLLN